MTRQRIVVKVVTFGVLAAIVIFGCWARMVNLRESLWLDELHTSWTVNGSLSQVAARAADGNQAPLFYWAEWLAVRLLGQHEFSLRLVSLLTGIFLIPVSAGLVWRVTHSAIAAIVAALLVAIDPDLIFFSLEARPYALVSLFGLIQMALFARLILGSVFEQACSTHETVDTKIGAGGQPARWQERLCFVGLTVLLFYLHYTTILILIPELILWAIAQLFSSVRANYSIKNLLVDVLITALCCLPAVTHLLDIAARRDDWSTIVRTWPIDPRFLRMLAAYAIPVSAIALIWVFARGCVRDKTKWQFAPLARIAVLTLAFLIVFSAVWLATKYQLAALLLPRYIAVLIVAPIAAVGLSVGLFGNRWLQAVLAVGVVAAVFSANYRFNPWFAWSVRIGAVLPMHADEDWRTAIAEINSQPHAGKQQIFLMSSLVEDHRLVAKPETGPPNESFVEYCKFPLQGIYGVSPERFDIIPLPSAPFTREFAESLLSQLETQKDAWIVARDPRVAQAVCHELNYLIAQRGLNIKMQINFFGNLTTVSLQGK